MPNMDGAAAQCPYVILPQKKKKKTQKKSRERMSEGWGKAGASGGPVSILSLHIYSFFALTFFGTRTSQYINTAPAILKATNAHVKPQLRHRWL